MTSWQAFQKVWAKVFQTIEPAKLRVRFDLEGRMIKFPAIECSQIEDCFDLLDYERKCNRRNVDIQRRKMNDLHRNMLYDQLGVL